MSSGIRLKYEDVKQFFVDQGCELLEKEYKNARTKMKYRCSCGKESSIVFDSFKRGNRCRECGNAKNSKKQTFPQEKIAKEFEKRGCTLLDTYIGSTKQMRYICSCGREGLSSWFVFSKSAKCKKCSIEGRSGPNHYEWKPDRELHNLQHAFRQRCYKLVKMVLNVTGRVKNKKSAILLGYDYKQLQDHITNHPNWEKVKDGKWHVDHIFPIKAFIDHEISDLKIINSLDNLQPLDSLENMRKNWKYDKTEFKKWLIKKGIEI